MKSVVRTGLTLLTLSHTIDVVSECLAFDEKWRYRAILLGSVQLIYLGPSRKSGACSFSSSSSESKFYSLYILLSY